MASSKEQELQRIQKLIDEQSKMWYELQREINVASGPMERSRFKLQLETVNNRLEELKQEKATIEAQPSNPVSSTTSVTSAPVSVENKTKSARLLQVFLCHSSGDKPKVRELYERLRAEPGIAPWLDEEELLPGQDWNMEIMKALRKSDAVLICISDASTKKEGYVQREIKRTLNVAEEKPDGTIFIIPVKLEECELPYSLTQWQSVDLFIGRGYERLVKSLRLRADSLES